MQSSHPAFRRHFGIALALSGGLLLAFVVTGSPLAATHDWVARGTVVSHIGTVFTGPCLPSATNGSAFRLDFKFDDAVADAFPADPNWGAFASVVGWKLQFAALADNVTGTTGAVEIYDDRPLQGVAFQDLYRMTTGVPNGPPPGCPAVPANVDLMLYEESLVASNAMTSDQQPTTGPPAVLPFTTTREVVLGAGMSAIQMGLTNLDVLGATPAAAVLPTSSTTLPSGNIRWFFGTNCIAGCWFDPPLAVGFEYETDGASRFTSIDDFPSGFSANFEVVVGGSSLGAFGPGGSVDFTGFPGGGVVAFTIQGITPGVDASDQLAFPLQLSLDTAPANFAMTSIGAADVPVLPAPGWGALALILSASGMVLAFHSKRSTRRVERRRSL